MSYGAFERRVGHRLGRLFERASAPTAATRAVLAVCRELTAQGCQVLTAHAVNGRGRVQVDGPHGAYSGSLERTAGIRTWGRWEVVRACPVQPGVDLPPVQVEWSERRLPLGRRA